MYAFSFSPNQINQIKVKLIWIYKKSVLPNSNLIKINQFNTFLGLLKID